LEERAVQPMSTFCWVYCIQVTESAQTETKELVPTYSFLICDFLCWHVLFTYKALPFIHQTSLWNKYHLFWEIFLLWLPIFVILWTLNTVLPDLVSRYDNCASSLFQCECIWRWFLPVFAVQNSVWPIFFC
jgi:hypothetical protein